MRAGNTDARKWIDTAQAVGVRDAKIFRHAGEIALKSGDHVAAERYLKESVELNTLGSDHAGRPHAFAGGALGAEMRRLLQTGQECASTICSAVCFPQTDPRTFLNLLQQN
jgi:hypothetical protein